MYYFVLITLHILQLFFNETLIQFDVILVSCLMKCYEVYMINLRLHDDQLDN